MASPATSGKVRRLVYDIETAPNVCLVWKAGYKISVSPESIVSERQVITVAWKWQGEKKVHALDWGTAQNDKAMLKAFIPILNSADESVAHFGDSFDLPWLKGRCLFHRIPTFPTYKTVDTKARSSKHFLLNSNKLDYLARYLGVGQKLRTEYDLWKRIVLDKDPAALRYMVKYNKSDVQLLEEVYEILAKYVPHHTHAGVLNGGEKYSCPSCASEDVRTSKTRVTAMGTKQHQMHCRCGTYFTINAATHKKYLAK